MDLPWVEALPARDDLAEKFDAFVSRFARSGYPFDPSKRE
jgi:hypothetical protein